MEQDNNKIMTVSFVASGFVVALVVEVLFEVLAASFGVVASLRSIDAVRHGIPVGFGIVTFCILQFNAGIKLWADEVLVELFKVVWPTKKDTTAMTTVVCVMLILSGVILGAFDFVSGHVIKLLLN